MKGRVKRIVALTIVAVMFIGTLSVSASDTELLNDVIAAPAAEEVAAPAEEAEAPAAEEVAAPAEEAEVPATEEVAASAEEAEAPAAEEVAASAEEAEAPAAEEVVAPAEEAEALAEEAEVPAAEEVAASAAEEVAAPAEEAEAPAAEEVAVPTEEAAAPAEEAAAPAAEEVAAPAEEEAAVPAEEEVAVPAEEAAAPAEEAAVLAEEEAAAPAVEKAATPAKEEIATPKTEEIAKPKAKTVIESEKKESAGSEEEVEIIENLTAKNGWEEVDGVWYYYENDAQTSDAWKLIDNKWYYFDGSGKMIQDQVYDVYDPNTQTYKRYAFDSKGHMVTGWYEQTNEWGTEWYYFKSNGAAASGVTTVDGTQYCFDDYGWMRTNFNGYDSQSNKLVKTDEKGHVVEAKTVNKNGWTAFDNGWYYFENSKQIQDSWKQLDNKWYYFDWSGKMIQDKVYDVYDPNTQTSKRYGFDSKGHMVTGWYEKTYDWGGSTWYYFGSNGVAATGLTTVGNKQYLFGSYGEMLTNHIGYDSNSGKLVKTDESGRVTASKKANKNGWTDLDKDWYYFENGNQITSNWKKINGYWYYFDWQGRMLSNTVYTVSEYNNETNTWTDTKYGFDQKGHMVKGWLEITPEYSGNSNWYYFDQDGIMVTGWKKINGAWYYFSDYMNSNQVSTIDGKNYYFAENGKMQTGWFRRNNDLSPNYRDTWFHAGADGILSSGWDKINGNWYYFDPYSGRMYQDQIIHAEKVYRVDKDGHLIKGWYDTGTNWYYFDPDNGGAAVTGIKKINGVQYGFSNDGIMVYNRTLLSGNTLYFINDQGKVSSTKAASKVNGWYKDNNGKWFYSDKSTFVSNQLKKINGKWYGFNYNGEMYTDMTAYVDGSLHGFDSSGAMQIGWYKNRAGNYYYFDANGNALDGMQTIGGKNYYFNNFTMLVSKKWMQDGTLYVADKDGVVAAYKGADGWVNDTYYVDGGALITDGWKKIDGFWYYFSNGEAYRNGLRQIDDEYYYFDSSKAMVKGWFKQNYVTSWQYADTKTGVVLVDDWMKSGNKWYYFQGLGSALGISYVKGGDRYLFNSDGSMVRKLTANDRNIWVKNDKDWYYLDKNGNYVSGTVIEINGKLYGFNYDGTLKNELDEGFGANGVQLKSQWVENSRSQWLYYDENSKRVTNSWKKINGKWYYFDDFSMVTGEQKIDGKWYNFSDKGVWDGKTGSDYKKGWNLFDGSYYYFDSAQGGLYTGLKKIGGKQYFFNNDGVMANNTLAYIHGARYLFGANGAMMTNAWLNLGNGEFDRWYYAGDDGKVVEGLQKINGKQYLFGALFDEGNTAMITDSVLSDDLKTFYEIDANGVVGKIHNASGTGWVKTGDGTWLYSKNGTFVTGYQKINGAYYYFNNGVMMTDYVSPGRGYFGKDGKLSKTSGWVKVQGEWQYLEDSLRIYIYGAHFIDGKWYYFADNIPEEGVHMTDGQYYYYNGSAGGRTKLNFKDGWNKYNGKWYYLRDGQIMHSYQKIDGKNYYFDVDGSLSEKGNFVYVNGNWRYLNADGTWKTNNWFSENGIWYYFDGSGKLLTGTRIINGKKYNLKAPSQIIGGAW